MKRIISHSEHKTKNVVKVFTNIHKVLALQ